MNYLPSLLPSAQVSNTPLPMPRPALTAATTDAQAVELWLVKHSSVPNTLSAYKKEAERLLFWLHDQGLTLKDLRLEHVLSYDAFLLDPQPREKWCLQQQPRYLAPGVLNPQYREVRKVTRYLKNGELNPAWRPFVGGLSAAAHRHALGILFGLYEFLVAIGYVYVNPFRAARKRSSPPARTVTRYVEKEVLQAALAELEQWPEASEQEFRRKERAIFTVRFLCLTGLRRSELADIRWEHIYQQRGDYWLSVQGKGKRGGDIPLTEAAVAALNRYRKSLWRGEFTGDDVGPVLMDLNGKNGLGSQAVHLIVTTTLRGLSDPRLQEVSAHWLRHSAASLMLDAGVPLQDVRDNLRHSNISTTSGYIHTQRDRRHQLTAQHTI
ncbi:MAG: tyrosine-type recombinase/integrase [Pseudomonas sp.]